MSEEGKQLHRLWLEKLLPAPKPWPEVIPAPKSAQRPALADLFSAAHVLHQDFLPDLPQGPRGVEIALGRLARTFEAWTLEIQTQSAESGRVVTRFSALARHVGPIGPLRATGRQVPIAGALWSRFIDRRAVETWVVVDANGILSELGALEVPDENRRKGK